VLTFI
jgi:actin-related protein